jgi:hypothetical protein
MGRRGSSDDDEPRRRNTGQRAPLVLPRGRLRRRTRAGARGQHAEEEPHVNPNTRTTLPEGAEVELALVEDDELDPEERERLHAVLGAGIAVGRSGDVVDGEAVTRELFIRAGSA